MKNKNRIPLELYIHIPFCMQKCQYCDFLSGPSDQETRDRYIEALLAEIQAVQGVEAYEIVSVFIGGGTPSVLKAEAIASIMETIQKKFCFSPDAEITIESNPGTVDLAKLKAYRKAGINRLSLGLQSTDSKELRMLGRIHTYEEFFRSYQWAREAGFQNINIDLMFAIPGQTGEAWRAHLRQVAELNPEHISAYSLIIEEGTPFARKKLILPTEDEEYQMYEDTAEILRKYGFHQYEISNYAAAGQESRHNLVYWQYLPYLSFGSAACSFDGDRRFTSTAAVLDYIDGINIGKTTGAIEELTMETQLAEYLFMGLRTAAGIDLMETRQRFDCDVMLEFGSELEKFIKENLLILDDRHGRMRLTEQGMRFSNEIFEIFVK